MSACMSGTRGSGVLSSTGDVLVRGVGGVCDMCMCLARGGVSVILILQNLYCQGKVMRNVHLNTEYVVLFRNPRDKSQFGHLARQVEPKHSKALVDAYEDATSRPYSHLLVDLKPHTPDALRFRSKSLQLDRQAVYVIGAVPT